MWNWKVEALFNAQSNLFHSQPPFLWQVCRELVRKHNKKEEICLAVKMDIWVCFMFYLPVEGACVSACVHACVRSFKVYLAIRRHLSTKRLSVHSGFKYIWPTPRANCRYEDFARAFYSLLSPFGCLCFSKSHAPYGRVYFSLYVPGMHFEYRCEVSKSQSRIPSASSSPV